jgi:flagellar hook assembly protein FlgD
MKTIKRVLATAALIASMTANANDKDSKNIYVNNDNNVVLVSVLNNNEATYKVFIYNEQGRLIKKSILGSKVSLGRQFDFSNVTRENYLIKIVSNNGASNEYLVNAGVL